jgi:hypothetical protein
VTANLFETETLHWRGAATLKEIIVAAFNDVSSEGYRPFSRIIALIGTALFTDSRFPATFWYAAVGLLLGVTAICFFLVAQRFLQSSEAATFATFLFLFTPSVITGSWVVFSGIQILVPLFICLGLLLYWRSLESGRQGGWYRVALAAVIFLGPWFREFIGLAATMIIVLELCRVGRPTFLMTMAALALLHAIFPTFIISMLVYPDLPVAPVFSMGHLGNQLAAARAVELKQAWSQLKWEMPLHFLVLYPPLAILIGIVTPLVLVAAGYFRMGAAAGANPKCESGTRAWQHRRELAAIVSLGATVSLLAGSLHWFGLWLTLGFVVQGARRDGLLAVWFTLAFVPFLKVFTEHVHLAYVAMPASIILVAGIEDLWRWLAACSTWAPIGRSFVGVLLTIAAGDHALNAYGSYKVVRGVNRGIISVADWFRSNVPEGAIVVTNAIHGEDIRLFANGHIKVYYTVTVGIPNDCDAVAEPAALAELLRENYGRRPVYFLDVDFEYLPEKEAYHSHKYVRAQSVAVRDLGIAHITRVEYPYLDPLKIVVPSPYVHFLGAPDLENDFYHGRSLDGNWFKREVHAEYSVYQVTGLSVAAWEPKGPVVLVTEGYMGFNILVWNGRYFGIPQGEGAFDIRRVNRRDYSRSFVSDDFGELLARIAASTSAPVSNGTGVCDEQEPVIVHAGYKGFRLVRRCGTVYAVPHGTAYSLVEASHLATPSLTGGSVAAVQRLVDWYWQARRSAPERDPDIQVEIVRGGYRGFDIIAVDDRYLGIPRAKGSDSQCFRRDHSGSFVASTYEDVAKQIDGTARCPVGPTEKTDAAIVIRAHRGLASAQDPASGRRSPVVLEQGYRGFNIVSYSGRVFAFRQQVGNFDWNLIRQGVVRPLFVGCSRREVVKLIDRHWSMGVAPAP